MRIINSIVLKGIQTMPCSQDPNQTDKENN